MKKNLELLMPAGDFEKLKFAFAYWADAVYVGAPMFSLRARTNTFTLETLEECVKYTRKLAGNKKIYFTTNIYAHNAKIKPFMAQFKKMVEMKPDAFIMADPGLIYLVRKEFPEIEIHLSVQANNTNWAQVEFWKEIGIKRIILSREISIKEMQEIHEKVPDIELEAFIHGAICMAYSGRCLISNYLSHRDSNQGTCSHSCRWEYKVFKDNSSEAELETATGRPEDYKELTGNYYLEEKERPWDLMEIDEDEYGTYLMNSRDLCAIDYLKDLKEAGIVSFKVEGRNKTVNYLASVGGAYRKALDCLEQGKDYDTEALARELFSVANRGYIPWFLAGNPNANAQFYERNGGFQTHIFLWVVRAYDEEKKLARIEVKNRFEKGDEIEFLTPEKIWTMKVKEIFKINNVNHSVEKTWKTTDKFVEAVAEKVDTAHGGSYEIWINSPFNPWEFAIIRKQASETEQKVK
jgi:U32 family peptidase